MPEHSPCVSPSTSSTPQVLTGILDLLKPEDSFSITLFSDAACTPKAFGPVSCVDIPSLEAHVGVQMKREGRAAAVTLPLPNNPARQMLRRQQHVPVHPAEAVWKQQLLFTPYLNTQIMKDVNDTSSTALSAGWDEGELSGLDSSW